MHPQQAICKKKNEKKIEDSDTIRIYSQDIGI